MLTKMLPALALILATAASASSAPRHPAAPAHPQRHEVSASEPSRRDQVGFVVGNMLFVGFHEVGHMLADQLRLPLLGRAEDAADSFATMALLDEGSEFSANVLVQAARGLFLMDRRDRKLGDALDFADAHGLDRQRAFQIVCLMVGSGRQEFKAVADWVRLPEERQQSCRTDYDTAAYAWHLVLGPHLLADQPGPAIEVTYHDGRSKRDADYAASLRSIGLLEALAEYVSHRYVLPRPITLAMQSCDDANAWWNPPTLTQTLCYELADDFVELYRGYTQKPAQSKPQANRLLARNAGHINLAQDAAAGRAGAGVPGAASWDRLEKLALDLESGTVALFTQSAGRRPMLAGR